MPNYNPNYDMPPRADRFFNKHPRIFAACIFAALVAALLLAGYVEQM